MIKGDPKTAAIAVILLTSYQERREVLAAKEVGMLELLSKPVRKRQLRRALAQALSYEELDRPKREPSTNVQRLAKLLVVEDNIDNQKLALRILEKYGYSCDIASNGWEALERLECEEYPLVLMDCQMPEMDGFQTTAAIRKQQAPHRTPIVAMTAHAMAGDRQKCLDAGMDDYLAKPINEAKLVLIIERWLRRTKRDAVPPSPEPAPAPERNASKFPPRQPPESREPIEVPAKPGLEDLIPNYIENRRRDLPALAKALENGDLKTARTIGHGMKGSGPGYGFAAIGEFGRAIEQSATKEDTAALQREISNLENYLSRLKIIPS